MKFQDPSPNNKMECMQYFDNLLKTIDEKFYSMKDYM